MSNDPQLRAHKEWLGLLQPVGLVVSPPALAAAGTVINRNVVAIQQSLLDVVEREREGRTFFPDFPSFTREVLGWEAGDLAGGPDGPPLPDGLRVSLPEYGETLAPSYAVPDQDAAGSWLVLVSSVERGADLDDAGEESGRGWHASPQVRLERLLWELDVQIGILTNGDAVRLVYRPKGETSGHLTFPVASMCEVGGRPILSAMHMLLSADRLFVERPERRLPALLAQSRKYQSEVSTKLAEQVLGALNELLRGFQAADEADRGRLLGAIAREEPQHIYGGLLTILLRLVFLLYAEDRGLMPNESVYRRYYSVGGLYERLREDAGLYPDTMDQRFGAWASLLSLFRLVFDGGGRGGIRLPARHGQLFNPDEYEFLEGRSRGMKRVPGAKFDAPRVPDGTIYRVLEKLLVLDGERLSYRTLDVEQIGSVYESMMGFAVERALGPSVAVKPQHAVVNLADLLGEKPADRAKRLRDLAGCEVIGKDLEALKSAQSIEDVTAAMSRKISPRTPSVLPTGALYLQPGEERRRTGSHYTPRSLTQPIVETTLRPVLKAFGERPTPEEILALKVCDPAMGSGAFLVEACRHLGDRLLAAWAMHDATPVIPPDEDPVLHARRLVAQRCLYGVDKNPFAVGLAKLSLWLVTLAKDHPFTFLDHALKAGDSLVGLTRRQIEQFTWEQEENEGPPLFAEIAKQASTAGDLRSRLIDLGDAGEAAKRDLLRESDDTLAEARLMGNLVTAAFFGADKGTLRRQLRREYRDKAKLKQTPAGTLMDLTSIVDSVRLGVRPVAPFHWEIEFPEVFGRDNPGFDAVVGNPPFLGGSRISSTLGENYLAWVLNLHPESHGNGDLVAHFFRRSFSLLRESGSFGLIATNTIAQGDTRAMGLRWLCQHGAEIHSARKRLVWPGRAAVIVSVIHIRKGPVVGIRELGNRAVQFISAWLFHNGGHEDPAVLRQNADESFQGVKIYGQGFLFDDEDPKATHLAVKDQLIRSEPRNAELILPFIGGAEVNNSPVPRPSRFVINFGDMSEEEARGWPDLMRIVEAKVKPERLTNKRETYRRYWWQYGEKRRALWQAIHGLERVLVTCQTSKYRAFTFLSPGHVFDQKLIVFAVDSFAGFAAMQARLHEMWALFFGSTMKDDPVYTPTDCFETFPFPESWRSRPELESAGAAYYQHRLDVMLANKEGLTATYNRFHDPDERDRGIVQLRELHAAMDRAVLDAYGWTDISTKCQFLLDYEADDENAGKRTKPWRYRWPDEVHDEVLTRLLDLNRKRAEEERLAGAQADAKKGKGHSPKKPAARKAKPNVDQPLLSSIRSEEEPS